MGVNFLQDLLMHLRSHQIHSEKMVVYLISQVGQFSAPPFSSVILSTHHVWLIFRSMHLLPIIRTVVGIGLGASVKLNFCREVQNV